MLPRAEYLASLPKKRMAAGALIRDEYGNILIVKPIYRADWLIPGGHVEANESPRVAAIREIVEEIGLDIQVSRLLAIEYQHAYADTSESLQFLFDGGVLTPAQIEDIKLPADELSEWRFVPVDTALQLLAPKLAQRIKLVCDHPDQTLYSEEGVPFSL